MGFQLARLIFIGEIDGHYVHCFVRSMAFIFHNFKPSGKYDVALKESFSFYCRLYFYFIRFFILFFFNPG